MASSVLGFIAKKSAGDSAEYGAFHVKSGSNIFLSNGWRTAHVKGSPGGFVYSSKPIPAGGMFQVKVLERGLFTFCIDIGFTRLDPDSIDPVPQGVKECWKSKDYWMFSESTTYHDGTKRDMSFSTNDLFKGDSVGVRVSENGDVQYYVNGRNKGVVFQHLPRHQDLWGVVYLWSNTKILSEFCLASESVDLTKSELELLQEKVSRLELAVQEKKGVATTQPVQIEQLTTHFQQQLALQQKQLSNQEHHFADQQYKNGELASRVENLTRELSTVQCNYREQKQQLMRLTAQVQQQRGQFQALLQQVQCLQPSWSIAQHHLQVTAQVLGRGAWGEVRVGIYQGTRVAVKKMHDVIISDHNRELFVREMIIASRVRHPHLVLFIGAVTTGNLTIVSELMETSLRKLLEEKKLTVSNLPPISKDVACALAYLHSLPDPIVHRDVSSANVLLYAKPDGWCAKLSDFGSANFLAKLGTIAPGAVIYSAPEALHPMQQGPKMDVYSFGILLFEMCVGKLIDQHNLKTTKAAVANWTDREKKFLGEFALRCTETNPDKRPNMADFVKQI